MRVSGGVQSRLSKFMGFAHDARILMVGLDAAGECSGWLKSHLTALCWLHCRKNDDPLQNEARRSCHDDSNDWFQRRDGFVA